MTVSTFIKENRVLVAGLVLPLLLIGILAIAKTLPSSMVPPPSQKVVFFSQGWSPKGQITLKINDNGTTTAILNETKDYKPNPNDAQPKTIAYIYTPRTNTTENIEITLDKDGNPQLPDKLSSLKLTSTQPSPDGYTFESYHYRNTSLITEIFAYHSYNSGPVLTKGGRIIKIPQPTPYLGSTEFLGWTTDEGTKL